MEDIDECIIESYREGGGGRGDTRDKYNDDIVAVCGTPIKLTGQC
jgi:hypothetical protein